MCIAAIAYKIVPGFPIIVILNRDEFHSRPTKPLHRWKGQKEIFAGQDERCGGTWFGVDGEGRFGLVTNYRDFSRPAETGASRGHLVIDFLQSNQGPTEFTIAMAGNDRYKNYNLVVGSPTELAYCSSEGVQPQELKPKIYCLSNHLMDTPWPKVVELKSQFSQLISQPFTFDSLFDSLLSKATFNDTMLPDTGIGLEWERRLAPIFVTSDEYGTRSSTIFLRDDRGEISVRERCYAPSGKMAGEIQFVTSLGPVDNTRC